VLVKSDTYALKQVFVIEHLFAETVSIFAALFFLCLKFTMYLFLGLSLLF